uniref:Rad21/Rec8-like protein N-terminal domain-containing protein n=1 Tax=Leersia perrieri TaxID=77586 RepID=A0A0D9W6H2_9ORYZ
MSCSRALLSKKGVLGTVWVAAVSGVVALSRDQIARTNIVACIDKISPDDNDETPHRILGLLLLGIVRIYSKKVEYLCHECNELIEPYGSPHCTELSISTGGSMQIVPKQVMKPVRERRLGIRQDNPGKVKKTKRAARTTKVSGMESRAEIGATSQISAEVLEACTTADLPGFTIPTRFELDSFDLGIPEDRDDDDEGLHHQLPRQGSNAVSDVVTTAKKPFYLRLILFIDTILDDENHHTSYLYESYKVVTCSYADLDSACIMPVRITIPTEMISAISEVNSLLCLSSIGGEPERDNQNGVSACFTPVKDILPPEMLDMMAEGKNSSNKSTRGKKPQRELNRDDNGDSACHIPLSGSQEGLVSENMVENVTFPSLDAHCPTIEEPENELMQGTNTNPSRVDVEEPESLESPTLRCKTSLTNVLSPSTPEPMTEGATGVPYSPKFMVTTPAKKEKNRVTRKRRRGWYNKDYIPTDRGDKRQVRRRETRVTYDENIILQNEALKRAIEDASDLVCKRRKAPHTRLDTWKETKISSLAVTFMDPLILYSTSMYFKYTVMPDTHESPCREAIASRCISLELSESNNICNDAKNVEGESIADEPRKRNFDEPTNSIQATVGCYTESVQYQDDDNRFTDDTAKDKDLSIGENESYSTGRHERLYASKSNNILLDEALSAAIDNIEDIPMNEEHAKDKGLLLRSTRTRTVARYFHQLLVNQKCQQENDSVRLGQALEGTKRKTSARFFYETLILKSNDLIEVNQEQPYKDIIISATPQLEVALESSEKQ